MRRVGGTVAEGAPGGAREHQLTLFERLDRLTLRARSADPRAPATALFCLVLALSGLGLLIQASHAATTTEPELFLGHLRGQAGFRVAGLAVMLLASRVGPAGVRPFIPALVVVLGLLLVLVFVPPIGREVNGSNRWIQLPGGQTFQPSELARLAVVLWLADRCARLGPLVKDLRRGLLPMLALSGAFLALIAAETDLGGAILLLLCVAAMLWVGGARPAHVVGTFTGVFTTALTLGFLLLPYVRLRLLTFLGHETNQQVLDSVRAMASGGVWGAGLGQGTYRNHGVPYLESDFVFAQVGEELGLVGMLLVVALFGAFLWCGARLVLAVRDRYAALACFGLLVSVALQAMLHMQIVAGLAPPKGMTLPFISHGGTSLMVSCLAVGLALGAARPPREPAP